MGMEDVSKGIDMQKAASGWLYENSHIDDSFNGIL